MFQLPAHPQPIGQVLDSGFKLFTASLSRILPLSFAAAIVGILPSLLFPGMQSQDREEIMAAMDSFMAFMPVYLLLTLWLYASLIYRMGAIMHGWNSEMGVSLLVGLKKTLPMLAATLLFVLAIMLGLLALIVPGLILLLSLFFYTPALVLDNHGIVGSLKRSYRLVQGNWWRSAAVLTIPLLIFMAVGIVAGAGMGVVLVIGGGDVSEQTINLYANLFNLPVTALIMPLFYAVMLVQYHDLKLRKEGGDLEQRLVKNKLVA
jgi:hypothetical protein